MVVGITTAIHRIDTEQVSANPQINEPEEKDESREKNSFADLLAGLLNAKNPLAENPTEISSFSLNETVEKLMPENNFLNEISGINMFSDTEETEDMKNLLGTQRLFADLGLTAEEASEGDFYRELSNLIRADFAPEAELGADFFDVNPKSNLVKNIDAAAEGAQSITQITAENSEASLSAQEMVAEINAKRERAQKKSDINEIPKDGKIENAEKNAKVAMSGVNYENEKLGRADEMRASRREAAIRGRNGNFSIDINDMRTEQNRSFSAAEASVNRINGETPVREINLEIRLPQSIPEQNNALNYANTSWEAKAGSALENLLARELHQNFNGDIVRHASMALKDGGTGTIKIALRPESLGNVKIALELVDNKITGQIFVESEEALNAFRKEIASLEQAFKESGFTAADLNLSLTSGGQNTQEWADNQTVPQFFASRYDDNSERIEAENGISLVNVFIGHRKSSINLLA